MKNYETWKTMKEIIEKSKVFHQDLPNNLRINKTSITEKKNYYR